MQAVVDAGVEITRLRTARGAMHVELLRHVAEMDAAEAWRRDGAVNMASWLVATQGIGHRTAAEWVRVARALEQMPTMAEAYASGDLSWDQVRAATRHTDAADEAEMARDATAKSEAQLAREARRRKHVELRDVEQAHHRRYLKWWWDEDVRMLFLDGRIPDVDGAVVAKALARIIDRQPKEPETGVYTEYQVAAADALVQMAAESIGADADVDRATVVIHSDVGALRDGEGVAEVEAGPVLNHETLLREACDCRYQIVSGDGDRTIGIGRATRSVPGWLARQVRRRDQGCRFPGCGRRRAIHIHHLVHWARGGHTNLDNLASLCHYHHRRVHEGGWRISGHPDGELAWHQPFGGVWRPNSLYQGPRPPVLLDACLPHWLRAGDDKTVRDPP